MEDASLEHTPTWVVAAVCFAIVSVFLVAERFLRYLGKSLKHKKQTTLYSALERLKGELLLLGFISFLLSLFQGFIMHICIPETAIHFMLPCKKENQSVVEEGDRLCKKIRKSKHWETGIHQEVQLKSEHAGKSTPLNFVLHRNHQGEFVSARTKGFWMKLAVVSWIIAFLKQFHDSVSKSDCEALRWAFILKHSPNRLDFDCHEDMIRALEHDFKRAVGVSWYLWPFVILFLLLNINGWHTYFWLAFLPLFFDY